MGPRSFIYLSGPYKNVGDALIRRRALSWAREIGPVTVLLGGNPSEAWSEALELAADDTILRSKSAWVRAAVSRSSRPVLFIEPGEFNTDRRFLPFHAFMLTVALLVRLRGGRVAQVPRSLARRSSVGTLLYRSAFGRRSAVLWREEPSWTYFRQKGDVVPDIAFDDPDSVATTSFPRDLVVVSTRSDRPPLDDRHLEWIKNFADDHALSLVTVSQVAEDDPRTAELARALDANPVLWGFNSSNEQEALVRNLYSRSVLVISDRLHVLVLAALHGASPTEVVPSPNGKAAKHFDVVGLPGISHDATLIASAQGMHELLTSVVERAADVRAAVASARVRIDAARQAVVTESSRS
ncbi:polysaccharide pyruvyl transferase family protein [Agreia sp.]|uniref:polysaccharide pyruvyl transferase family protein n=1 Tax=Agreia sp. TaxID=1872416 RepID=UPI0035BC58AA